MLCGVGLNETLTTGGFLEENNTSLLFSHMTPTSELFIGARGGIQDCKTLPLVRQKFLS
jgi:hypothetical protein